MNSYVAPDITQGSAESIIYTVDWPCHGLPPGQQISTQLFLPAGTTDYTLSNIAISDDGLQTVFQLTGGIPGTYYSIINQVTLQDGEIMQAPFIYKCVSEYCGGSRNLCI